MRKYYCGDCKKEIKNILNIIWGLCNNCHTKFCKELEREAKENAD